MTINRHKEQPVAHLPVFIRRQLGLLAKSRFPYDDLVRIRFGSNAYMLTDVADIRHVLVGNSSNYLKTPRLTDTRGKRRAGTGLLTSSGAEHRRQRLLMQPLFHQQIIDRFADVIENRTQRMLQRWQTEQQIDIASEMSELALSTLMGMLFGIDFEDEDGKLAEAIHTRRRYTEYVYHSHLPFRELLPTRTVRENTRAVAAIDQIIYAAIEERRACGAETSDMVSLLMRAEYPDGSRMSDQQVRDEVLTLTSTGHETIGDSLGWTWYLLCQHPNVENQLLTEMDEVLGGRLPRAKDFAKLNYTNMVLSESLRLYTPTWIYTRVPLKDDLLPSGHTAQAGSTLFLCPYVVHRHPRYFPDPERFEPERFCKAAVQKRPKTSYFPFGVGPHTCIGEAFARLQGVLVLAHVTPRVRFELLPNQQIIPAAKITLYPKDGILVRLFKRG